MITDYIVDNFEAFVRFVVGAFIAITIACGFFAFVAICYVLLGDWKRSKKK